MVIGDTPADIRCGHFVGARVLAVCTGHHGRNELAAENPMAIHDDLSDFESILRTLVAPW
jgi:phosphoglycolate phosphatase